MTSQGVDIFSMLNKAQTEYNQQQNSVAAFFRQASHQGVSHNNSFGPVRSMPIEMPKSVNSLEQIERQIRPSPPLQCKLHHWLLTAQLPGIIFRFLDRNNSQNNNSSNPNLKPAQPDLGNSPLAQFFNSNNFAPQAEPMQPKEKPKPMNGHKISAPPGFNTSQKSAQANKETKLITPAMFAPSNNNNEKKSPMAEPLTKNQMLQALTYLIANDDEFMMKIHQAYIQSFNSLSS